MNKPDPHEEMLRAIIRRRMSRREVLRYAGRGAGAIGAAAVLAACGVEGTANRPRSSAPLRPSPLPSKAGELNVANWPLYIDLDAGESATLDAFREQTGISITYKEDINDNDEFFGTDLRQQLSAGQSTGWDVVVLTDWMVAKLIRLGWVEPLHHDRLPNFAANADPKFTDPWYDPGNAHSAPWAAGITGIGYNPKLTGREITSLEDLFDPAFTGHVGMFSEMRDTIGFGLLRMGMEPSGATVEDVEQVAQMLTEQRDAGIVRGYYGNDYTDQLAGGNVWLTMAWSGDVFALAQDDPDLQFVIPQEGGMRWVDNMVVPLKAEHPTDAHEWVNFVYEPEIAAAITEWVWYESPLDDEVIREIIRQDAKEFDDPALVALADDTTVWPDDTTLSNTHVYKNLDAEEEEAWHDLFDPVIQG